MKSTFNTRLMSIAAYLVIAWCVVHLVLLMLNFYGYLHPNAISGVNYDAIPLWFNMMMWIYNMPMAILLSITGFVMMKLVKVINTQGLLIEELGKRINQIMLLFGGVYALNVILESIVNYQNHSGFPLTFLIEISCLGFLGGAFYLLTRVLFEAIRLKAENDLTI